LDRNQSARSGGHVYSIDSGASRYSVSAVQAKRLALILVKHAAPLSSYASKGRSSPHAQRRTAPRSAGLQHKYWLARKRVIKQGALRSAGHLTWPTCLDSREREARGGAAEKTSGLRMVGPEWSDPNGRTRMVGPEWSDPNGRHRNTKGVVQRFDLRPKTWRKASCQKIILQLTHYFDQSMHCQHFPNHKKKLVHTLLLTYYFFGLNYTVLLTMPERLSF